MSAAALRHADPTVLGFQTQPGTLRMFTEDAPETLRSRSPGEFQRLDHRLPKLPNSGEINRISRTPAAPVRGRLLFVDDDPALRSLYELIGSRMPGFDVHLAASGSEACTLLEQCAFDIVLSDLTMPGMDGLQVMREVVRIQPGAARIIISGYASQLKMAECLSVAHRCFSKPFHAQGLIALIERICACRSVISNDRIRRLICGVGSLPTPPPLCSKIDLALSSPYSSSTEIGLLIEQDPALSAKLLQIVNSVQIGLSRRVFSPAEAVQILGLDFLRSLLLGLHLFSLKKAPSVQAGSQNLWEHSFKTAIAARKLAEAESLQPGLCEQAFLGGLLHDVGKLVIAANAGEDYISVLRRAHESGQPLTTVERDHFGASHAEIGAYLLALWGLPEEVIRIVEFHHSPGVSRDQTFSPLTAVFAAQYLCRTGAVAGDEASEYLSSLDLSHRLDEWSRALAVGSS